MNGVILLILYILIFILQITFLVKVIKYNHTKYWYIIFLIEVTSIVTSTILTVIYNNISGSGFMPGLSYFGHFLFSFCAAIIYTLLFIITIGIKIFRQK